VHGLSFIGDVLDECIEYNTSDSNFEMAICRRRNFEKGSYDCKLKGLVLTPFNSRLNFLICFRVSKWNLIMRLWQLDFQNSSKSQEISSI